jgi:hypothetical protein
LATRAALIGGALGHHRSISVPVSAAPAAASRWHRFGFGSMAGAALICAGATGFAAAYGSWELLS